ncbi:RNA polymerase sigma factor [Criibacterium bergeronii]|uniref:RNA polymerase sigma factor n=1 Tax=Criibacterium bergeronii TaxID=1871336 RepID=A0A371IND8_9FIRM|nr:RNA polymerase sigma factor [Criibacterium bergeronii]RDY22005.1 RNA polymerase sigma factor [Criibacterium bergeronii]
MDNNNIVKGIKAGDKNAFDILYQQYNLELFRTAFLILGNSQDAQDVLQETFICAYINIKSLRDEEKLKAWLFTIMKNFAYKKIKKRDREVPDENILLKVDSYSMKNEEIDYSCDVKIEDALMKINPKQREVLVLYYYSGFSIKEIAKITGNFQGTVKSRLHLAKKQLKKIIENDFNLFESEGINEG